MEFGVISLVLLVGYVLHRVFHRPRPTLDIALEHIERGAPVRAEYVAEQALRAARGPGAKGRAGIVLALVLVRVGDYRRAREAIDEAIDRLKEAVDDAGIAKALEHRAVIDDALADAPPGDPLLDGGPGASDAAMRLALGPAVGAPEAEAPDPSRIADRCAATGGCGCGPAGEVDADASRAFAELLEGGRASGLVRAAEVRREGDKYIPRVTVVGELTSEQERTLERAVQGAMGVLFGGAT